MTSGHARRRVVVQIVVGSVLLAAAIAWVGPAVIRRLFASADPGGLIALLLLITADRLLVAGKWWLLLRAGGVSVHVTEAIRAYYISSFAGIFLPMTIGADIVRAGLVAHGEKTKVVSSILVERGIGLVAQCVLILLSVILLAEVARGSVDTEAQMTIAVFVLFGIVAVPGSFAVVGRFERHLPASGALGALRKVAVAYASFQSAPITLVCFSLLTLVAAISRVMVFFVAARTLHIDAPFLLFLAAAPLALAVARLPISLGGLGVLEAAFAVLAYKVGIGPGEGVATALLAEVAFVVSVLPGAFLWRRLNVPRHTAVAESEPSSAIAAATVSGGVRTADKSR